MNRFYFFLKKRSLFVLFAFVVNILVYSFSQQEYKADDASERNEKLSAPNPFVGTPSNVGGASAQRVETTSGEFISANIENVSEKGLRYRAAIREYTQSISLSPDDYVPYYNRGIAYFQLKDYANALNDFKKADLLAKGQDVEVKNNIGVTYARQNKYDEALKAYDEAIKLDPSNYKPYNNKGIALNAMGYPKDALKILEEAIKLNPAESKLYNNKGVSLSQLHQYVQAVEEYNKSLRLDPYNHNAYNNRGIALAKLERQLSNKN